jgi:hypothetical protein
MNILLQISNDIIIQIGKGKLQRIKENPKLHG